MDKKLTIAALTSSLDRTYEAEIFTGMTEAARELDINFVCLAGGYLYTDIHKYQMRNIIFDLVSPEVIDGIVIPSSPMSRYTDKETYLTFLKSLAPISLLSIGSCPGDIPVLRPDYTPSVVKIIQHMLEKHGRRKFAIIKGLENNISSQERVEALQKALHKCKLTIAEINVISEDFYKNTGARSIATLLDQRKASFDTLISFNDNLAIQAVAELRRRRIRVPEDVAVISFQGSIPSLFAQPALTVVSENTYELGKQAVTLLAKQLRGGKIERENFVPTHFLVRSSCGCAGNDSELSAVLSSEDHALYPVTRDLLGPLVSEKLPAGRAEEMLELTVHKLLVYFNLQTQSYSNFFQDIGPSLDTFQDFPDLLKTICEFVNTDFGFLVLYEDKIAPFTRARLVSSYHKKNSRVKQLENQVFDTYKLLPDGALYREKSQQFVVLPLFHDSTHYGYLVLEAVAIKGYIFEAIIPLVSSALAIILQNQSLEQRVLQRTKQLETANRKLKQEIEERKNAESELLRLVTAIEQLDEIIIITDTAGKIIYTNPAFERITGYTFSEAKGRCPDFLNSGQQDELYYRHMWDTIKKGGSWSGELVNRKKDGTLYNEEMNITPIRSAHKQILGFVAVKRDITERLFLEQKIRESVKMQAIGTLAGGIAHDFNNILGIILGYTELVQSEASHLPAAQNYLGIVFKAVERAKNLVNQILSVSHQTDQLKGPLHAHPIIDEVCHLLKSGISPDIIIKTDKKAHNDRVLSATGLISQILMNLCTNACYAMRETGGILEISTENTHIEGDGTQYATRLAGINAGAYLKISVKDSGSGIKPADLERIFEPYYTTKKQGEGCGLGLSVVLGLVEEHGGFIETESTPGKGSNFQVYLPLWENN